MKATGSIWVIWTSGIADRGQLSPARSPSDRDRPSSGGRPLRGRSRGRTCARSCDAVPCPCGSRGHGCPGIPSGRPSHGFGKLRFLGRDVEPNLALRQSLYGQFHGGRCPFFAVRPTRFRCERGRRCGPGQTTQKSGWSRTARTPEPRKCKRAAHRRRAGSPTGDLSVTGGIQVDRLLGSAVRTGVPDRLDRDAIPQRYAPVRGDRQREG